MSTSTKPTNKRLRLMLYEVIGEIDYDLAKFYDTRMGCSEDPEASKEAMTRLIGIVRKHIEPKAKKS